MPFIGAMQQKDGHATAFVCRDFACREPVTTAEALAAQLTARHDAPRRPRRVQSASRPRAAFRLFHPKGNIVTAEMIRALGQSLETIAENPHLKLVTIEGAGADFSFGASIPEHAPGEIERVLPEAHALI